MSDEVAAVERQWEVSDKEFGQSSVMVLEHD